MSGLPPGVLGYPTILAAFATGGNPKKSRKMDKLLLPLVAIATILPLSSLMTFAL